MLKKKGDIFEAWCHDFMEVIDVKALDDEIEGKPIGIEYIKGGHWAVASRDPEAEWPEWETWI